MTKRDIYNWWWKYKKCEIESNFFVTNWISSKLNHNGTGHVLPTFIQFYVRRTSKKYELIQDKLEGFSRSCSEVSVWCQTFTKVPIQCNLYNTCPTNIKLNKSRQDMSLPIVIQFGGNPGCNKKVTFNFTFFVLSSLIVNVIFCHEVGGRELCKLYILVVVS